MAHTVDARGLSCPQPVVLAKKALADHDEVVVLVDDATARENVRRLAAGLGCEVSEQEEGADTRLTITRQAACPLADEIIAAGGEVVAVIGSDTMGSGDDNLGALLMKSFIHTLLDTTPRPDVLILFNTGVRLAVTGSEVLDDLQALAGQGTRILVCGTCLGFFELKDRLAAGSVSNMYDIAQTMLRAGRVVRA
jgi:selenium metabolism protein YedF